VHEIVSSRALEGVRNVEVFTQIAAWRVLEHGKVGNVRFEEAVKVCIQEVDNPLNSFLWL
jgi:hypothetical protein